MGIPDDYTVINKSNYYMVGRNLKTDRRYVCERCDYQTIRRKDTKCPRCERKIIWF
jgi:hypothetical protein